PEDRGRSAQSVELAEAGRATRQVACQHGRVGHVAGRQPIEPARLQGGRSEEHTSELQSRFDLVCRLLLEKKKQDNGRSQCNPSSQLAGFMRRCRTASASDSSRAPHTCPPLPAPTFLLPSTRVFTPTHACR